MALLALGLLLPALGCAVPQPRGDGDLTKRRESTTGRSYYLYLPKDYVEASPAERSERRWPLVVTFHGMKPFDVAHSQAREWEQEADRYGYVVVAPILRAFAVFGEFPLRSVNSAFKSDEEATLAILNEVFETTQADRNNVLSTSWSSGGYLAHYMLNRHPDVFTCLAVRQSNFSSSVLSEDQVSESLYHPVLILSTENDFAICKRESQRGIEWYEHHGYKNFAWVYIRHLGHQRTPDTAADFFARVAGVKPNRPPRVLMARQALDGNPTGIALLTGRMEQFERPPTRSEARERQQPAGRRQANRRASADSGAVTGGASRQATAPAPTARRQTERRDVVQPAGPLGIRVSSTVGFEPLLLQYSAVCPESWQRSAEFNWRLNGEQISQGINGQRTLLRPGDYMLELQVVTQDGREHRVSRQIRVLRAMETQAAQQAGDVAERPASR